mgnify:FL=1
MSHPGGTLPTMSHQHGRPLPTASPGLPETDDSWIRGPLLGFDTETTGVNPRRDRLVTAAIVARGPVAADGTRSQQVRTWLADPGVKIPASAVEVHGISTERARAEGLAAPEVLDEVAAALATAMESGTPVVAFNGSYDLTLMESELARHALPTVRERLGRELGPVLDPLVLDRRVDRYRRGKRRLSDLCEVYGVSVDESLHTAEVDVMATLDILEAMVHVYPELARLKLDELVPFQAAAHRQWAESLNEWLARKHPDRPRAELDWPLPAGL